ncbi:MAG TPA: gamma-glutamyltransferase [Stellaceae bacterium]|jgi:gamma-glutamyltranspeptidase/glutathione hydrolase|nr:gamma-glutamyltransferase [Stellaceae bacterium]
MIAPRLSGFLFALSLVAAPAVAEEPERAVEARHGMVVSAQHEASDAGLAILQAGGNAIDAAVAVGYGLAVVDPCCGNIGGGGFMLIRRADGHAVVLDFRETAPQDARRDLYLDATGKPDRERSLYGYIAAGVPGTVMGLDRALTEYGKLSRAKVMAPAIALARDGFVLGESDAAIIAGKAPRLAADPEAAKVFLRPDGNTLQAGDRLMQADLAHTLSQIAEQGPDAFYRGSIAAAVTTASSANGGIFSAADFASYTIAERAPIACDYRGYRIVSAPPPSSGGTILCEMLNIISGWDLAALPPRSAREVHLMAEAMRRAYRDRNSDLGDPSYVSNPLDRLLSSAYATSLRASIDPERATPSSALAGGVAAREKPETTHYSVLDAEGNAVAVTYTLNGNFGAVVMPPGTGFLLNNEMDDFTSAPGTPNLFGLVQGEANAIQPGKRPLSSMSPTIVEKDGRPVLVLGSPGGPRITTAVLETLVGIIDHRMLPADAVVARRFHHQWLPDSLYYERGGLDRETVAALTGMGHHLTEQPPWGAVELIAIDGDGRLSGVNDPRRPAGAAKGY